MDKVQQNGAAAGGLAAAPCQRAFKIGGWFEESPEAIDSSYGADGSDGKEMFGGERIRVEPAVMADQKLEMVLLRKGNQTGTSVDVCADQFLAEDVNTSFCKLRREGTMGVARSTDDGSVRSVRTREEGGDRGVEYSGMKLCNLEGRRAGIYDREFSSSEYHLVKKRPSSAIGPHLSWFGCDTTGKKRAPRQNSYPGISLPCHGGAAFC
jgi:hypothetical protein